MNVRANVVALIIDLARANGLDSADIHRGRGSVQVNLTLTSGCLCLCHS
jgi:hypothetical protein